MSGPIPTQSASGPDQDREALLQAHIRLLQDMLDETARTDAALDAALDGAERQIAALLDQIDALSTTLIDRERHIDALRHDLQRLEQSLSWRVTAPLRALREMLRRIRQQII